jgi:rod shape determining protein RodA
LTSVTQTLRKRPDFVTFGIYLGLVAIGWLMIFTVGYEDGYEISEFLNTAVGKQTIWIGISFFVFFLVQFISWKFWQSFAYPVYIFTLLLLVGVLIFGANINGATSWFRFGGFTIQPSELAKVGTCLAMAALLGHYSTDLRQIRWQLIAASIFAGPMLLILLQPDAGSALVFTSFLIVLYRAGLPNNYYIIGIFSGVVLIMGFVFTPFILIKALILLAIIVMSLNFRPKSYGLIASVLLAAGAYFLYRELPEYELYVLGGTILIGLILSGVLWTRRKEKEVSLLIGAVILGSLLTLGASFAFDKLPPHQQDRINVWLRPGMTNDKEAGYNLANSQMAIGAGGLEGKGFLNGTLTKGGYVPEQMTDFIFCTIGEEQGFVGSMAVIILFLLLLFRITIIAERQRTDFVRYYAYGVAGIIFIHFLVNIGMTMRVMPVIGIPLPFISKGGSSLLGFSIMLGILLKMDSSGR